MSFHPKVKTPARLAALGLSLIVLSALVRAQGAPSGVTLKEDSATYTLDNGIVTAMVAKDSGDLVSLKYKGREVLGTLTGSDGQPDLQRDPPGDNPNGLNR